MNKICKRCNKKTLEHNHILGKWMCTTCDYPKRPVVDDDEPIILQTHGKDSTIGKNKYENNAKFEGGQ